MYIIPINEDTVGLIKFLNGGKEPHYITETSYYIWVAEDGRGFVVSEAHFLEDHAENLFTAFSTYVKKD